MSALPPSKQRAMPSRVEDPTWLADVLAECPPLLTLDEVASLLRVDRRTVERRIAAKHFSTIRHVDSGTAARLVPRAEIGRYLSRLAARRG